ncbi:helix-turn-helix transcriptional regulator [Clostridium sp. FS41]|jgi:transcriptional regulator with XRE-family HTH domain|uniref:helix-turn-helix domain-containing protein n=1 Tax=Clostridium sp. FS41 TaxID=1609975 RepID=UPI00061F1D08|nr:helix-turn-helix transcriptional regulator [Clostridium sp. FS41]KJJ65435.1 helix-turn-helix protein [Clostridium sp. FS41]
MPDNQYIGSKIKKLRKEKQLTQVQLAEKIGKTESSVRKYEKGLTEIPISVLEDIANALDTTIYYLGSMDLNDMNKDFREQGNNFFISLCNSAGFQCYEYVFHGRPGFVILTDDRDCFISSDKADSIINNIAKYARFSLIETMPSLHPVEDNPPAKIPRLMFNCTGNTEE